MQFVMDQGEKLAQHEEEMLLLGSIEKNRTKKDENDIQTLLELWENDFLDNTKLGQQNLLGPFKKKDGYNRDGWRLDSQSTGPFVKFPDDDPKTKYQNFAVQNANAKGKQAVYSCVIAPLGQNPGPTGELIIDAYNKSMELYKVAVIKRNSKSETWEIIMEK